MITKIYQIKETCPMWNDGTGIPYEKLLPKLLTSKEDAERYKEDLEITDSENVTCLEFEIIELDLSNNYKKDIYDFHKGFNNRDIDTLEECGRISF